jgi:hypothetical protein
MTTVGVRETNALTARWARAAVDGGSTVLSGAALWPLLGFLATASGVGSRERAELEAALGLDVETAAYAATSLVELLGSGPAIRAALGLWCRDGVGLDPQWASRLPAGTVRTPVDAAAINAWIREQTGGLLSGTTSPIAPGAELVLAMALAARTRWQQPFEAGWLQPQSGPWRDQPLAGLTREQLTQDEIAVYATVDGPVTLLDVAGEDDITVHLVLGEPERAPGAVLAAGIEALQGAYPSTRGRQLAAGVDASDLAAGGETRMDREFEMARDIALFEEIARRAAVGPVGPGITVGAASYHREPALLVRLPCFDLTAGHNLLDRADLFGLTSAATYGDRLPLMAASPLYIGSAQQDLTASFSKIGFEAAAVTVFQMSPGGMGPRPDLRHLEVTFDRPFGFVARQRSSGLVLVAGWVADPLPADLG